MYIGCGYNTILVFFEVDSFQFNQCSSFIMYMYVFMAVAFISIWFILRRPRAITYMKCFICNTVIYCTRTSYNQQLLCTCCAPWLSIAILNYIRTKIVILCLNIMSIAKYLPFGIIWFTESDLKLILLNFN